MLNRTESAITNLLQSRMEMGVWQSELESMFGFSKSNISETVKSMESRGLVVRRKEGNVLNRAWLTEYFPGNLEGVLRIGILRSSEYLPALMIIERICMERKIKPMVRTFKSSVKMLECLSLGSLELAMAPAMTQIIYASIRIDIRFLSSIATGGSSIYENTKSESNLCSGSEISTMALMTRKFLERLPEVTYVTYENAEDGISDFLGGKSRYIAVWEPYCSYLENQEGIRKIYDYSELLGNHPCCILSYNVKNAGTHKDIHEEFKSKYGTYCDTAEKESPALLASGILGEDYKEFIEDSLKHYKFVWLLGLNNLRDLASDAGISVSDGKLESLLH